MLIDLNAFFRRKSYYLRGIRRCSLLGENMSLCMGFGVSKAQVSHIGSFFLLPLVLDVELLVTSLSACLHVCWCTFCHDVN